MTEKPDLDSPESSADWEALARYLAGESPPAEAEAVRRWLDARPDRAELVAVLGGAVDRLAFVPPSDLDVEAALRRVHERMAEPDVRPLVPRADPQPPRPMFRQPQRGLAPNWLRVAAAIVFIAAGDR
jgi:anti-sigma factor RsiW